VCVGRLMIDHRTLLGALQHGDSFFPSGATAFSWGLETLVADRAVVTASDLEGLIAGQLTSRWATCDRPALYGAHDGTHVASGEWQRVLDIDQRLEALSLAEELRSGSRRAGAALLAVHERLGTPGAADYRRLTRRGEAPGHLAVVQGIVWRGVGLKEPVAAATSAHALCIGVLGGAVRLGLTGNVEAQRILASVHPLISRLIDTPPAPIDRLGAFTPEAEIAAMRHESAAVRLFAN
jgi:urease accessory protein